MAESPKPEDTSKGQVASAPESPNRVEVVSESIDASTAASTAAKVATGLQENLTTEHNNVSDISAGIKTNTQVEHSTTDVSTKEPGAGIEEPTAQTESGSVTNVGAFESALLNPDATVAYDSDAEGEKPASFVIDDVAKVKQDGHDDKNDSSDSSSDSSSDEDDTNEKVEFDEDEDGPIDSGPVRTKNEILDEPVKPIDVEIPTNEHIEKVGIIEKIVGQTAIIKAFVSGEYQVLDQDSILVWSDRQPFGRVFETLGPVQQPIYSVKFFSETEANQYSTRTGETVYYVPRFSKFVFTQQIKAIKGSDASNWNDEEVDEAEQEFSDDEAEAEFKRRAKEQRKRAKVDNPGTTGGDVSFGDLAGQDATFLEKMAAQLDPTTNVTGTSAGAKDTESVPGMAKTEHEDNVPRGTPKAPRGFDDEPYKPLTRPSDISAATSRTIPGQDLRSQVRGNRYGPSGDQASSNSQKRRSKRRKRKTGRDDDEQSPGKYRDQRTNDYNNRERYQQTSPSSSWTPATQSWIPPQQQPQQPQPNNVASLLQQFPSLGSYVYPTQQSPPPQQPAVSQYDNRFPQNLPPGAHVNPAFLNQYSQRVQRQTYDAQPAQANVTPQQSYLSLLQQQLQAQQQNIRQNQHQSSFPTQAPTQAQHQHQAQPNYQNQSNAQLQHQLQSILLQMQANSARQQGQGLQPNHDAGQSQLDILRMLGQGGPPGPSNGPR
ncbi:Gar1/Naf1 RNA binding region-domain-containing protein [Lipomyces japonicus]|uniref:Gar1/Naf1 RNA binding region-domain-containing protein n=1 Tax=Lipomyces japonicus TaxID=56871 RepID=UPI0034CE6EE3